MRNPTIIAFARKEIINGLKKLPEDWQHRFKQMYWPDQQTRQETSIEQVVNDMPAEKLDWALTQIENSLRKQRSSNEVSEVPDGDQGRTFQEQQ